MRPFLIGMGWFDYQKGGLNKYFLDLVFNLEKYKINYRALAGHKHNKKLCEKRYSFQMKGGLLNRFYYINRQVNIILEEFNPNIVNFHFALTAFPLLRNDKISKLPKVFNFQGPWALEGLIENKSFKGLMVGKLKFLIEKIVYSKVDKFIVLSNVFKHILYKKYGIDYEKIEVIPPGIDYTKFKPLNMDKKEIRRSLGFPEDKFIIFTVRRLVKRMGLFNLIKAISLLKKKHSDILLLIGGKGYLYQDLLKLIKEYNLENEVKLLGYVDDEKLIAYYNLADLTVMPTEALEGFGLVTLESLSCGTPVMATPVDANLEVIGGFNKNLLFSDKTPEAIAEGLNNVLNGRIKLPSNEECRNFIIKNFSWDLVLFKILKVWNQLL